MKRVFDAARVVRRGKGRVKPTRGAGGYRHSGAPPRGPPSSSMEEGFHFSRPAGVVECRFSLGRVLRRVGGGSGAVAVGCGIDDGLELVLSRLRPGGAAWTE